MERLINTYIYFVYTSGEFALSHFPVDKNGGNKTIVEY